MNLFQLVKFECLKLSRSFSCWGILAGTLLIGALVFKWQLSAYSMQSHLALEQSGRVFGVSTEVIRPFWGWCLLLLALITPILNLILIHLERQNKGFSFWVTYRVQPWLLVLSKTITLMLAILFFIASLTIIPLTLWAVAPIDLGLTLSGTLTVFCVSMFLSSISTWFSLLFKSAALYLLVTYGFIALVSFVPAYYPALFFEQDVYQLSFLSHAYHMMHGRVYLIDLWFFAVGIAVFLSLSLLAARRSFLQTESYFR